MPHVLIAGVSTRAAAESAARAGFEVTALDAFADLDQHPGVRALSLSRDFGSPFTPRAILAASRRIESDASVYLSSLENHPRVVASLGAGRQLWGNAPAVLRCVRDPVDLAETLRVRGFDVPALVTDHSVLESHSGLDGRAFLPAHRWLIKPRASGGGHGIRWWQPGSHVPRDCHLQQFVEGTPGSIVFVAARGRAVPLGVSRQLVGECAFGAAGFRYCGNILATSQFPREDQLMVKAVALADAAADAFDLIGIGGIDFVAADGVPHPIELNPRWSASMELMERAYGISVFAAHVDACTNARLPAFDFRQEPIAGGAVGKAVLFARRDCVAGDTHAWLGDATVRDVPRPGERILAGHPVCTVFAEAPDGPACHAALVERAGRVFAEIEK